jgi:hypothetical protein
MKNLSLIVLLLASSLAIYAQDAPREYYQLKTYSFANEEQVQMTDDYLANAFLPALKRLGINAVGVFKPRAIDSLTPKETYVLIPFNTLSQFEGLDAALANDQLYIAAGKDYVAATYDKPPYQRIESTILKAFVDMPKMQASPLEGPRKDRIYEMRSYESATEALYRNKVDMFNAGGEVALFDRLGFNAVFYAEVLSGSQMPNLMYMTTFPDQESREEHWKSFVDAPEWNVLKEMPKYQNNVSRNDTRFLYPTEYSDY